MSLSAMAVLLALALLCARFETPISSLQHSRGQHRAQVASCKALPDRKRHLACVDAVDFKFSSLMYLNYEPVLRRLVRDLLHDCCLIGNGSIVDAGAHTGSESALYAASRPSSIVHRASCACTCRALTAQLPIHPSTLPPGVSIFSFSSMSRPSSDRTLSTGTTSCRRTNASAQARMRARVCALRAYM